MHDAMYGHLIAAMRFGADEAACRAAIDIAFKYAASTKACFFHWCSIVTAMVCLKGLRNLIF